MRRPAEVPSHQRPRHRRTTTGQMAGCTRLSSGLSPSASEFHRVNRPLGAAGSRAFTAGSELHRPRSVRYCFALVSHSCGLCRGPEVSDDSRWVVSVEHRRTGDKDIGTRFCGPFDRRRRDATIDLEPH